MNAPVSTLFPLRPEAAQAPASGIVEVMTYGRLRPGMIPLWAGEGDMPTPAFICDAAARSLAAGETFYTWQRGIPDLREALVRYHERLYGKPFDVGRFSVTVGGMHAAQIAGGRPVPVPMRSGLGGWTFDLDRVSDAVTPRTRAIVVNSPANPTGWTAGLEDLRAILALARRHRLWIIADEIYARFVFDPALAVTGRAPSFHDVMEEDDRILFVQTFSKNWAMTGWRIGWLEAPPGLGQTIENLIQYSTSGVATFLQRGALAALEEGEGFAADQIAAARRGRDIVCEGLNATGRVELPAPPGAFYAFLRVPGVADSRALALQLIDEANVGLAPGTAFGAGGEAYLRLCFARRAEDLHEAVRRLAPALERLPA